jgi:hypothetical protein
MAVRIPSHVDDVLPTVHSPTPPKNDIQSTTTNTEILQQPIGPKATKSPIGTIQEPDHVNDGLDKVVINYKSAREIQEERAWQTIKNKCRRRSPTEHLQNLRQPQKWALDGWMDCAPVLFNRSDTFARFLHRSAILKINATVRNWREIFCQKECCKDKFCRELCCKGKWNKKMKYSSKLERKKHLRRQLYALGEEVMQWRQGKERNSLVQEAIAAVYEELQWRSRQKDLEKVWEANLEYVKQEMEEKMEGYGLSLDDLHELEEALVKAEKEEAIRIEEQERLEKEKLPALNEEEEEVEEDDEDDDFDHLYADPRTPSRTLTDGISLCEQDITACRPMSLYQLENGPLTPPATETQERTNPRPTMTADEEFGLLIIKTYIDDLTEEREKYSEKRGITFHPEWLNEPPENEPYNPCAWKLHPVSDLIVDYPPSPSQKYPNLRVTDPEGNVFTLEEQLPALPDDFECFCLDRRYWGLAVEELIHRGCGFELGHYQAVQDLYMEGWEAEDEDDSSSDESDSSDEEDFVFLGSREEFDITGTKDDGEEDQFDQEITHLEPGQPFDITDSNQNTTNNHNQDPELALIGALIDDVHKRQRFYQNWSDEQFWWAITKSNPPPAQVSLMRCPWKLHLVSEIVKDTLPTSNPEFPDIYVTDPEGNVYSLEEQAATIDESFEHHLTRDAWQSRKEIALEENEEETDEECSARLQHLAQWETELRQTDDLYVPKETTDQPGREDDIKTRPNTRTDLEKARDAIEAYDRIMRDCLFEVKHEFIQSTAAKFKALLEKEREDEEWVDKKDKVQTLTGLSRTLVRLREKFARERMVRMEKGVATYVGEWRDGVYWVEMKGNLGEVWEKFRLGGED